MDTITIWAAALAIALGFIAVCLWLPVRLARGTAFPDDRHAAIADSRRTYSQVFGGAAIILTFTWTFLKDSESLEQARQQAANGEFLASARLMTESTGIVARAAAIFSLGRIASVRQEYHMPVRETLAAFLTTGRVRRDPCPSGDALSTSAADVQAAVQVLGDRNVEWDTPTRWLDLGDATLVRVNFSNSVGYRWANFQHATLYGADFRNADLRDARFEGACGSDWTAIGAKWDVVDPHSDDWLTFARYPYVMNFAQAHLEGASLKNAELAGAIFVDAHLAGADFAGANLSRADFRGAKDLATARFGGTEDPACADAPVVFDEGVRRTIPPCHR